MNANNGEVPNCANGASDMIARMYPGDGYVDWTGIDGYATCTTQSPSSVFDPAVRELRGISSRPISVDEVGSSTHLSSGYCATLGQQGSWIGAYFKYIESAGVRMSLWFNSDGSPDDWAVFSSPLTDTVVRGDCSYGLIYSGYCEYANAVSSSYFTTVDPSNPRLLSDAEFLGTY